LQFGIRADVGGSAAAAYDAGTGFVERVEVTHGAKAATY
jgi:hypothetical protein